MRIILVSLPFLAFVLPVVVGPASSVSFNLFDLAEWASLVPAERSASPALMVSFALRLQMLAAMLIAVYLLTMRNVSSRALPFFILPGITILSIAQLPPLEILSQPSDPNYRQQLFLALSSFLISLIIWRIAHYHYAKYILIMAALLAGFGLIAALHTAQQYLTQYQIFAAYGAAAPVLLIFYLVVILTVLQTKRAPQRSSLV